MGEAVESLRALGLNQLEAETYAHLSRGGPQTGYRVAKALGRPTANVYKAIEALAGMGAVLLEEGEGRICRAVPPGEFLGHRRRALLGELDRAEAALASSAREVHDEAIYQIRSASLAMERARSMLARCTRIAVVDAFPASLREIEPALREAAARGVDVYLLVYEDVSIPGVHTARIPPLVGDEVLRFWSSEQLNLTIDGLEALVALFDEELQQVHQAVWTASLYLSSILHAGMMREHTVHQIASVQHEPDALSLIQGILSSQPFFHNTDVPGQRQLLTRFGPSACDHQNGNPAE